MPIEIRELVIKVKIEESGTKKMPAPDMETIKKTIEEQCKKEVKRQLDKIKER